MDLTQLPATGTCDLTTTGRRTGEPRRIEIWYVVVEGRLLVTGTPGTRGWLANLRANPVALLHLRAPATDVRVIAREVVDPAERQRLIEGAWRVQPWYAAQRPTIQAWVERSPLVELTAPGA